VRPTAAPLRQGNLARWTVRGATDALQVSVAAGWRQRDARLPSKEGSSQNAQKAASPSLQDSRSVAVPRPWSSKDGWGGRSKPASVVLPRRAAHDAHTWRKNRVGDRDWQTQGDSSPRKRNGVSRRARRRSRGCARTLFVSFAEVDRRSWLREALPPVRSPSKEGRGTRWTGAWPTDVINRSKWRPLFQAAFTFRTKLFAAKLCVAEGAVGDEKTDSRQAGCATPRF